MRRQPEPMLLALGSAGAFDSRPHRDRGDSLAVITQRTYVVPEDEIRVDMVLLWSAPGSATELWIEAKIGAALSGPDQLLRYGAAKELLASIDGVRRPPLVLLAPSDLTGGRARWLSWQKIADVVRAFPNPDALVA